MYMNYHYYNKNLKDYARELRTQTVSRAERYLWKSVLSKKQTGYRFLRQRPIDNFIVDFFCPELKLIIEIDGNSHWNKGDYDKKRQTTLENLGFTIIRYQEGEVLNNLAGVIVSLEHLIHCLNTNNSFSLEG